MSLKKTHLLLVLLIVSLYGFSQAFSADGQAVYVDPDSDFQSVMVRQFDGNLLLIFEKFNLESFTGDLWATMSSDNGLTWSVPYPIITSSDNERHPALLELEPGNLVLFYHKGAPYTFTDFRIYRATSEDGITWTEQGPINLGWSSMGEMNPSVIQDGNYITMTYNRAGGPSYIARSQNQGVSWDTNRTQVSDGASALPRVTKRESDGLYLVSYEVGIGNMELYGKTSNDIHDWSAPEVLITTGGTNQDSRPLALEGGAFMVAYAHQNNSDFNIFYQISVDGTEWSPRIPLTSGSDLYKLEPFLMHQGTPGHLMVIWSQQKGPVPYLDQDIWIHPDFIPHDYLEGSGLMASAAFVKPGNSVTHTVTLSNSGYYPLSVVLVNEMPAFSTYTANSLTATAGQYSYNPVTTAINWNMNLNDGESESLSFAITIEPDTEDGTVITNIARFTDNLGVERTESATVMVDAAPPTTSILTPANGQLVTSSQVLVSGTASDSGSGIAAVQIQVDDGPWQTVSGIGNWSLLITGLSEGRHDINAQATDAAGNVQLLPEFIHFQVDTIPPFGNVEIYLPAITRP